MCTKPGLHGGSPGGGRPLLACKPQGPVSWAHFTDGESEAQSNKTPGSMSWLEADAVIPAQGPGPPPHLCRR